MAIKEPSTAKPDNGEAQPTPFYRRRSVQAGGAVLALLTAGGLFAGLKPSHQSEKAPQPTPTTAPTNTSSPSPFEKQSPTPPLSSTETGLRITNHLCTGVPTATILQAMKIKPDNLVCNNMTEQDIYYEGAVWDDLGVGPSATKELTITVSKNKYTGHDSFSQKYLGIQKGDIKGADIVTPSVAGHQAYWVPDYLLEVRINEQQTLDVEIIDNTVDAPAEGNEARAIAIASSLLAVQ